MKLHAFVAMPFGTKPAHDGKMIDFNRVYAEYIEPALRDAGLEVFRADEEIRAGDIRTDMFQELLMADVVIADLTLDNPNVWYELGVRHALRARGVVLVQGPRQSQPFDIYTDRKLRYNLKDGAPDPATLALDRKCLTDMVRATLDAWHGRKVSPVYSLLPHLREPDWKKLLLEQHNEFSASYEEWSNRLEIARQKRLAGDILVLAEEAPTVALRIEAKSAAGDALLKLRHYDFALEQFNAVLALDPKNKFAREKKAICYGRLDRKVEAREAMRHLTMDYPNDPEIRALAGRVEKESWINRWRSQGSTPTEWTDAARSQDSALTQAIEPYYKAFSNAPDHYYSGINALTLSFLRRHLGGEASATAIDLLTGGVRWSSFAARERNRMDYWAQASYAEFCLLVSTLEDVRKEYRATAAATNRDWFALDSIRQTLCLLRDLEFRPAETAVALDIIDQEIAISAPPFEPRQVFLFSGHMIDTPDRAVPRFPADKEAVAAESIAAALKSFGAGPGDLALAQGACGGDLLFLEACQKLGVRLQLMLPLPEPEFIGRSILPSLGGEQWRTRYFDLKSQLEVAPRIMPTELGSPPKSSPDEAMSPFERCNLWLQYSALAWGVNKVRFICLWNGSGGDGPGGTEHMYKEVKRRTGRVAWLDTRKLW